MSNNHVSKNDQLGFIGLGNIGFPIVSNLIANGYKINAYRRPRSEKKIQTITDLHFYNSPKELAKVCNILMLCVTDEDAVEEILFGELGASSRLRKDSIVIDFSTISPRSTINIAKRLSDLDIDFIDSPVTGGTEAAIKGNLTLLLGGKNSAIETVKPILKIISKHIHHFGEIGNGQKVKAINQILVAGTYAALAEGIALGKELSLPMDKVISALAGGAADSWALRNRSSSMLGEEFPLGFKVELHKKDLEIALSLSKEFGIKMPISSKVKQIEEDLIKNGMKDKDIAALRKWISMSKINPTNID